MKIIDDALRMALLRTSVKGFMSRTWRGSWLPDQTCPFDMPDQERAGL